MNLPPPFTVAQLRKQLDKFNPEAKIAIATDTLPTLYFTTNFPAGTTFDSTDLVILRAIEEPNAETV